MKILLTGGTGMVGHNIKDKATEFAEFGAEITAPGSKELNLLNEKNVKEYINEFKPDMIIHAAGMVGGINANMHDNLNFMVNNLDMGRNLILAAKEAEVKKLLNLGSSCMYPRIFETPIKEEQLLTGELEPTNEGYAIAKLFCTRLCQYISRQHPEFSYKTAIPCNLFGRYDKFDEKRSHVLPNIIRKIHEAKVNNSEVEIWGNGEVKREFLYAEDVADFIVYAVKHFDSMPQIINLGSGIDYTINEYYKMTADVIGFKGSFYHNTERPEGMKRKLMDNEKLKAFGWQPKFSLKEGISRTYRYFLENEAEK